MVWLKRVLFHGGGLSSVSGKIMWSIFSLTYEEHAMPHAA